MLFLRGQVETAMDHLIQIVKRDRDWEEDKARQAAGQVLRGAGPEGPGDAQGPPDAVHGPVQLSAAVSELASSLPDRFPVFPLRGAMLLPGGNLPLNIFEPRYLQMVRDAMQTDRVIGMIQPKADAADGRAPDLYRTGCAGRITNFSETDDGRFLITLTGVCRFDVASELEVATPYRQVTADFARWRHDLQPERAARRAQGRPGQGAAGLFRPARHRGRLGARSRPRRWPGWSPRCA